MTTKPARSVASIGCLPRVLADEAAHPRRAVSAASSASGIELDELHTGAGLKKWTPSTWSARLETAPSFTIGIDDVLDASIASGEVDDLAEPAEQRRA